MHLCWSLVCESKERKLKLNLHMIICFNIMIIMYVIVLICTTLVSALCGLQEESRPSPFQIDCSKPSEKENPTERKDRKDIKKTMTPKAGQKSMKVTERGLSVLKRNKVDKAHEFELRQEEEKRKREIELRAANDLETVKEMQSCWGSVQATVV